MPRTTERGQALQAIESALESTVLVYLLESSSEEEDEDEFEENIGDLSTIQEVNICILQDVTKFVTRHRTHECCKFCSVSRNMLANERGRQGAKV